MHDPVLLTLHERLEAYITSVSTLRSFHEWFVPNVLGPIEDLTDDQTIVRLVYAVELRLSEHDDGIWTERALKRELRHLLHTASKTLQLATA